MGGDGRGLSLGDRALVDADVVHVGLGAAVSQGRSNVVLQKIKKISDIKYNTYKVCTVSTFFGSLSSAVLPVVVPVPGATAVAAADDDLGVSVPSREDFRDWTWKQCYIKQKEFFPLNQ